MSRSQLEPVMWLIILIVFAQLLCGYWVVPVESQITGIEISGYYVAILQHDWMIELLSYYKHTLFHFTVSRPIRHTLPPELESGLFGSPVNGGCSSTSGTNNEICDGTSVLNDGIIPALSGVSNDPASQWANELVTMRRSGTDQIVVSVEVPSGPHNRMELTVFNCPQLGIYAPQVIVYIATSLSANANLQMVANVTPSEASCEYLWKFCIAFSVSVPNINLVFPYKNNSDFVFLVEVTFLNDRDPTSLCGPPELITMRVTPTTG